MNADLFEPSHDEETGWLNSEKSKPPMLATEFVNTFDERVARQNRSKGRYQIGQIGQ